MMAQSPSKADLNLLEDALCIPGLKPGQKLTAEDILGEVSSINMLVCL